LELVLFNDCGQSGNSYPNSALVSSSVSTEVKCLPKNSAMVVVSLLPTRTSLLSSDFRQVSKLFPTDFRLLTVTLESIRSNCSHQMTISSFFSSVSKRNLEKATIPEVIARAILRKNCNLGVVQIGQ